MKRMLAISWMMPPLVFPRAVQVSRLFKGLTKLDWEIDVVTSTPTAVSLENRDDRLGALYGEYYRRYLIESREDFEASSISVRAKRFFGEKDCGWGLDYENWRLRAGKKAIELIGLNRPDVFVTFAQPWIDHIIGLDVKERMPSLPWIASFSDPWADSILAEAEDEDAKRRDAEFERRVVEKADAVVFTTQQTMKLVMRKYPSSWASKAHVVSHASDDDLVAHLRPEAKPKTGFRFVHAGSLYEGKRFPSALLEALSQLKNENPALVQGVSVEFVGKEPVSLRSYVADLGVNEIVEFRGQRSYFESLNAMAGADWLLLFDMGDDEGVFLPSKIADYALLDRPILFFTPKNGAVADVAARMGYPTVEQNDVASTKELLRSLLSKEKEPLGTQAGGENPLSLNSVAQSFDEVARRVVER